MVFYISDFGWDSLIWCNPALLYCWFTSHRALSLLLLSSFIPNSSGSGYMAGGGRVGRSGAAFNSCLLLRCWEGEAAISQPMCLSLLWNFTALQVDAVLCDGPSPENIASTVVDCTKIDSGNIGFFRVGIIPKSQVKLILIWFLLSFSLCFAHLH